MRSLSKAETVDFGSIAHELEPRPLVVPRPADVGPLTEDYGRVLERAAAEHDDARAPRALTSGARPDALPVAIDLRHETSNTEDFGPAAALRKAQVAAHELPPVDAEESPREWNAGPRTEDLGPPAQSIASTPAPPPRPLPGPARFAPPAPPPAAPVTPLTQPPEGERVRLDDGSPKWVGIVVVLVIIAIVVWALSSR